MSSLFTRITLIGLLLAVQASGAAQTALQTPDRSWRKAVPEITSNDKFALVVFRGSEIWKKKEKFDPAKVVADLMTDVDIRLVK